MVMTDNDSTHLCQHRAKNAHGLVLTESKLSFVRSTTLAYTVLIAQIKKKKFFQSMFVVILKRMAARKGRERP